MNLEEALAKEERLKIGFITTVNLNPGDLLVVRVNTSNMSFDHAMKYINFTMDTVRNALKAVGFDDVCAVMVIPSDVDLGIVSTRMPCVGR